MGRGSSITDFERGEIKGLFKAGQSIHQIAREIGRSRNLVRLCIQQAFTKSPCKSTTQNKALSACDVRNIRRHSSNRKVSAKALKVELNLKASITTIRRAMVSAKHLKHQKMLKKPKITEALRAKRRVFADQHVHWMDEWKRTVFSDEKKFNLDGPDGWSSYWHDLRKEKLIFSKRQQGGGSVMIWLAISRTRTSSLHVIEGTLTSDKYTKILSTHLLPLLRDLEEDHGREVYFQQDNASVHSSHAVKDWLDKHGILTLDWPVKSPDLSPIENVFGILARRLYAGNRQFSTVTELRAAIIKAWEKVAWKDIYNVVDSMHQRMIDLIANNGRALKY